MRLPACQNKSFGDGKRDRRVPRDGEKIALHDEDRTGRSRLQQLQVGFLYNIVDVDARKGVAQIPSNRGLLGLYVFDNPTRIVNSFGEFICFSSTLLTIFLALAGDSVFE